MRTRELERHEWQSYFDSVSKQLVGKGVEIEILSRELGAQQDRARRLFGITYDPKDNTFEVITDNLGHSISDPNKVMVQEDGESLRCIDVAYAPDGHEVIQIKENLGLPH